MDRIPTAGLRIRRTPDGIGDGVDLDSANVGHRHGVGVGGGRVDVKGSAPPPASSTLPASFINSPFSLVDRNRHRDTAIGGRGGDRFGFLYGIAPMS